MEVTTDNFTRAYNMLEERINSCDFIAIDGEFTGLSTIRNKAPAYDTVQQIYEKNRIGTSKMLLVQYGICLFIWDEETKEYEAVPFSFYIFPRPYKKFGNDVVFTSQSSSLNFLAEHGFDFNKLFHKGVSFMGAHEEKIARANIQREIEQMVEKEKQNSVTLPNEGEEPSESKVFIPKDQREFVDGVIGTMKTFFNGDDSDAIDLPVCTAFQRKLLYERLDELYPLGLYLESATNENNEKFIRAHKTLAGYKKNVEDKMNTEQKLLEEKLGFTKVIRLMSESGKPIIGHNMFKDLFLTYSNFFGDPPPCMSEYKTAILNLFPTIYDSKVLATTPPLSNILTHSSVESLVKEINEGNLPDSCTKISQTITSEDGYSEHYHDAGYDAFSTGRIFISLSKNILSDTMCTSSVRIDPHCVSLSSYMNRVYIMGIRDVFNCNFAGEDCLPDRRNVFHITFPSSWKQTDIKLLFTSYSSNVPPYCFVSWISDTSAFVTVDDSYQYDDIFDNLVVKTCGEGVKVLPYLYYINKRDPKALKENGEETIASACKRKRTSSSDIEEGEIDESSDSD